MVGWGGGGGGLDTATFLLFSTWIFNKLFTVRKHQSLLLQPSALLYGNPVVTTKSLYEPRSCKSYHNFSLI